jgi:hypothetical protein
MTLLSPGDALAEDRESSAWAEAGLGVAALLSTVVWGTTKTICAVGGTLTAGLAYVFTGLNSRPARTVLQASLRGDYVVTPKHLRGEEPLSFIGRDPQYEPYPYD